MPDTPPDWSREVPVRFWDPGRRLLRSIRQYQALQGHGGVLSHLARKRWVLAHRFWSVVTQADIPLTARLGGGLLMPHPNGIVIHPDADIGINCMIFQQVTVGLVEKSPIAPRIGAQVDIGAGAKVLGPVSVGDHARIGANAVVTRDIPAGMVATGIPATARPRRT
ncbi:MAG: serine acetyltransferase [Gemmobacter sp.]|nr:serine acetyltransferase [Gemmobacter sp.]